MAVTRGPYNCVHPDSGRAAVPGEEASQTG